MPGPERVVVARCRTCGTWEHHPWIDQVARHLTDLATLTAPRCPTCGQIEELSYAPAPTPLARGDRPTQDPLL